MVLNALEFVLSMIDWEVKKDEDKSKKLVDLKNSKQTKTDESRSKRFYTNYS